MGVSAERANELLKDFHNRVYGVIANHNLADHQGTSMLNPLQSHANEFTKVVMDNFTQADTTEGMIESESERYLTLIEQEAKRIQGNETKELAALGATINSSSPADSPIWNRVVSEAAKEVDRISKVYGEVIVNMPKMVKDKLDTDLAKVLDQVEISYRNDPSSANAERTSRQLKSSLKAVEKHLDKIAKASMKNEIDAITSQKMTEVQEKEITLLSLDKSMTKEQSHGWRRVMQEVVVEITNLNQSNYLVHSLHSRKQKLDAINSKIALLDKIIDNADAVGSALAGYFGNSGHRFHSKQPSSPMLGRVENRAPQKNFNKGKPPGFRGFAGKMDADQLRQMYPNGANSSHIRAVQYFMTQGLSFQEANQAATSYGYKKTNGVLNMDLDIRAPHLGGGANPFF